MRLPIGYALGWPDRVATPFGALDWSAAADADLRAARPLRLPLHRPGLRGRPARRLGPGLAQRGQRGRRRGLPGQRAALGRHRRRGGRDDGGVGGRPGGPGRSRAGGRCRGPGPGPPGAGPTPRPGWRPVALSAAMTLTEKEAPAAQPPLEPDPAPDSNPARVRPAPGGPGPDHGRLHRPRLGLPAALHRHPLCDRHAARVRPLRDGQAGGHEGDRVLRRVRPAAVVGPAGRDRVRREGHSRRRLRAHHRVHLHRGGARGGRGPGLPPAAVPPADHRGLGRVGHALPHRLRAGAHPGLHLRADDEQLQGRLARALAGTDDAGRPGRPAGRGHHRLHRRQDASPTPTP